MREMGIASSLVATVETEMRRHRRQRATRVGVKLGEQGGVSGESLKSCFEALVKDAALEPLTLEIQLGRAVDGVCVDDFRLTYLEFEAVR